jgi:Matrixin
MKMIAACALLAGISMGLLPQNGVASNLAYTGVDADLNMGNGRPDPAFHVSETLLTQLADVSAKVLAPLSPAIVKKINRSVPVCVGVNTKGSTAESQKQDSFEIITIDPLGYVANSLVGLGIKPSTAMSVQVLKGPSHGAAVLKSGSTGFAVLGRSQFPNEQIRFESNAHYTYESNRGFQGGDQIIFLVTLNNTQFRVKVNLVVRPGGFDNLRENDCEYFEMTKVSLATSTAEYLFDELSNEETSILNLEQWQRSATLSALIASAQQTLTGFTDLPATALGQTIGEGATATTTLDQNAAGHGWYIDPTPLDNSDDYLPTSDASVWQAKAGSAAASKMDMLSVLLHEYGHALGLEHSGSASDFMAASLQPGVRKLPSSEELALMSQLVAQLKAEQGAALTPALSQRERGVRPA